VKGLVFRYVFADLAAIVVSGILIFSGILLVNVLFKAADLLLASGVRASHFLDLILALAPYMLIMTIPISLLLALLMVYGRMAEQNEFLALAAGGVNYTRILAPGVTLSVILFLFMLFTENVAAPKASALERIAKLNIIQDATLIGLEEGAFNDRFPGYVIYVRRIEPGAETPLQGIVINRMEGNELKVTILSREGSVSIDENFQFLTLNLIGGTVYAFGEESHTVGTFTHATFGLNIEDMVYRLSKNEAGMKDYTTRELVRTARDLEEHLPSEPSARENAIRYMRRYWKEFYSRQTEPAVCLALPFLAIPLALWTRSGRKSMAFGLSLVSVVGYYFLLILGRELIRDGTVSPAVGEWMPVVVLLVLGAALTWKVTRR